MVLVSSSSSSSSSLDVSSIVAEVSAACTLSLGHGFGVPCLFLPWHAGLSGQFLYWCPGFLQPKHLPAANSFMHSSSDILSVFAASNCMGSWGRGSTSPEGFLPFLLAS